MSDGHFDKTRAMKTKHRDIKRGQFSKNIHKKKTKHTHTRYNDGFYVCDTNDCQILSIKSNEKCEYAQNNFSSNFHV